MRRIERWIFSAGTPERLAAIRIGLCSALALRLTRTVYLSIAGQPHSLYRPLSFMHLLHSMPPWGVVLPIQVVGGIAAVLAALGWRARQTLPLAWACGLFLGGMTTSLGKVVHNDVLLLLCMVPLLPAPVSDAWSLDARAGRTKPSDPMRYGWPVQTALIVVAGSYFFSGFSSSSSTRGPLGRSAAICVGSSTYRATHARHPTTGRFSSRIALGSRTSWRPRSCCSSSGSRSSCSGSARALRSWPARSCSTSGPG